MFLVGWIVSEFDSFWVFDDFVCVAYWFVVFPGSGCFAITIVWFDVVRVGLVVVGVG